MVQRVLNWAGNGGGCLKPNQRRLSILKLCLNIHVPSRYPEVQYDQDD
jgi:hypothetical protein